jgi:hypothetical protein
VIFATPRALRCRRGARLFWVPRSQVAPASRVRQRGDSGDLVVLAWFASKAGLTEPTTAPALDTLRETARVYRRLMLEFHPDRNPAGAATARALNEFMAAVKRDFHALAQ